MHEVWYPTRRERRRRRRESARLAREVEARLPRGRVRCVGRDRFLRRLNGAVESNRVVVIVAERGVGKTTVLRKWARRARRRFADGYLYADLNDVDSPDYLHAILTMWLRRLRVPAHGTTEQLLARFRDAAAGLRLLILIENAHSAAQVRALLPLIPHAAVITGRSDRDLATLEGTTVLTLERREPYEAGIVLARAAEPQLESPEVRRAAAALAALRVKTIDLHAVAAVTGLEVSRARAVVDTLARVRLVEAGERVELLPTLRPYASRWTSRDARARLLNYYIDGAAAGSDILADGWTGPAVAVERTYDPPFGAADGPEVLRWYKTELQTVRELMQDEDALGSRAWLLSVFFLPYLYLERPWQECLDFAIDGLRLATEAVDPVGIARCLHLFGWILHELKQDKNAVPMLEEALALHERIDDGHGRAWALHGLGESLTALGKHDDALRCFELALDYFRAIGWGFGIVIVRATMMVTLEELGRTTEAIDAGIEALAIAPPIHPLLGRTHHYLGELYKREGLPDKAREHYGQALEHRRRTGQRWGVAETLRSLAGVCAKRKETKAALEEAYSILHELHDRQALDVQLELLGL